MYTKLFLFFLKLGSLSFGGGYPMISYIFQEGHREIGLTLQEFTDMAALELLASGPIIINSATYVGYIKTDIWGAVVATAGVTLPSFIFTAIVYKFLHAYSDNVYVKNFMSAIKLACGGILLSAALVLMENILFKEGFEGISLDAVSWGGIVIVILGIVGQLKFKINPILIILISMVLGAFIC